MIVILTSSPREANALARLTANRTRAACTCGSISQFKAQLRKTTPALVITRTSLTDGYSDDVLALLAKAGFLPASRVIVLAGADCAPQHEARQLALGADCVLRDPLRPGVLVEYMAKFLDTSPVRARPLPPPDQFALAGATVLPGQQQLRRGTRAAHLSPMEVELARRLAESPGQTVTYHHLYSELFNRTFAGDSANLRVLFGKLAASYRKLGINLRDLIQVTPKSGYCYLPATRQAATN